MEVALGYAEEDALREASRCLQCKRPTCVTGCPVAIDIPALVAKILEKDYAGANRVLRRTSSLPAVCGRVCPQETQCEAACVLARKGEPVAIGRLERFAADNASTEDVEPQREPSGFSVAIVGGGPASLTCAGELIKYGHGVTVYEALHKAGGVLVYGIPEFRLPNVVVESEIENIERSGVRIVTNFIVGKTALVDDLLKEHDAVFVGTGAGAPSFLGIEGENLAGVYSANEFLTRINLMNAYRFPAYDTPIAVGKRVAVIGGGNVAMDAVRTALRCGAREAHIIYRRSAKEIPARAEEIHHAEEEGVKFDFLRNPIRIVGKEGSVAALELIEMELSEPDESGRRRPVPIPGSEHTVEFDTVVVAIGQTANPIVPTTTEGLELTRWGNISANEKTGATSREGIFAGGDIVPGAATVILAMGAGRNAALAIDYYLSHKGERGVWKTLREGTIPQEIGVKT